jgi:ATP:corrinoid adenosyltransferase
MPEGPSDKQDKQEARNSDEVALELMKFIAVTTGYGKGTPTAGFGGKGQGSSEEYASALIELFERCRTVINKPAK